MAPAIEPREAEAMAITLTRMEGKLDSVVEKVSDLRAEVTQHRGEIRHLQSVTQQLESDMKGAEEARSLAASAVRDADAARVAQAKALVDNSTQRWTPVGRFYATIAALAAVAGILYYFWIMSR
jgi:predicted  nucleic acid-binding Zn-ribbon protein